MEKPGSRLILDDEFVTTVVFEPTSPRKMLTTEFVPLTLTSWRLPSSVGWPGFPFGLGGRSVTSVYDLLYTRPATDVVPRFQLVWPRTLANVSEKLSLRIATWTARSGAQLTHVGDGVLIVTAYHCPAAGNSGRPPGTAGPPRP